MLSSSCFNPLPSTRDERPGGLTAAPNSVSMFQSAPPGQEGRRDLL
jgi:hypothetical protein